MQLEWLTPSSDLARWAAAIAQAVWDDDNAIDDPYTADSLARYLGDPDTLFLVAHENGAVLGMASGCVLRKPYGDLLWLYVDEVDVAVPHRRRGIGKALMTALLSVARARGCDELWLGAERDNGPAVALYRSLQGEEAEVLGYSFDL
jgi:ribosomal protein S18 acetylase RimI-like enzyme